MEGEVAATRAGTARQTEAGGVVLKAERGLATVETTTGVLGTSLSHTEGTFPGVEVELQGADTNPTCEKEGVASQPGWKKAPPRGDIPCQYTGMSHGLRTGPDKIRTPAVVATALLGIGKPPPHL